MNRRLRIGIGLVMLAAAPLATGLDCTKASSIVEKQICGNAVIAAFDNAVADAYAEMLRTTEATAEIEMPHKQWLAERDRCEDLKEPGRVGPCVEEAYRKRLRELGARAKGGLIAPSFECAKARAAVEELVCGDAVLAALDKGLAKAFARALMPEQDRIVSPQMIRAQQRVWLQRRAECEKPRQAIAHLPFDECVRYAYSGRLLEIDALAQMHWPCPGFPLIRHEAEKAECLNNWLALNPLEPYWPGDVPGDVEFCAAAYQAFAAASPDIHYIEPVLATDDSEHPRLERYRQCRNREAEEITGLGYDYFGVDKRAHGFRLYRLDLDGNPANGLEEYLYAEESSSSMMNDTTQYVRVDFGRCEVADRLQAAPQRPIRTPRQRHGMNAMIRYLGRVYIYEQEDYGRLTLYPFERTSGRYDHRASCVWKTLHYSTPSDQPGKE